MRTGLKTLLAQRLTRPNNSQLLVSKHYTFNPIKINITDEGIEWEWETTSLLFDARPHEFHVHIHTVQINMNCYISNDKMSDANGVRYITHREEIEWNPVFDSDTLRKAYNHYLNHEFDKIANMMYFYRS